MLLDNHLLLISLREELGYIRPEDTCHGFAVRWIEACLVGEENLFENRIKAMHSYGDSFIDLLQEAQLKEKHQLSEEDNKLFDIHAFLDHLDLHQSPEYYSTLFGRVFSQSDIESISDIATSDTMRSHGGLCKIYSWPGLYTEEEIKQYLYELSNIIDSATSKFSNICWGIIIGGYHHSLGLTYTPATGWRFTDNEQYPPLAFCKEENHLLAETIVNALIHDNSTSNQYTGFNTSIFTTADNELLPAVITALDQFNEQQIITKDLLTRETDIYNLANIAVQNEQTWVLAEYLKYGLGLEKNYDDYPLLYLAAQHNDSEIIDFLCQHGAEVNALNHNPPPLHRAGLQGDVASILLLAKHGADVNIMHGFTQRTPVYVAAKNGQTPAIVALVSVGANLYLGDNKGTTPLHVAAKENQVQVIRTLIELKVEPNVGDDNGATPLHFAAKHGRIEAITVLIELGAMPNLGDDNRATPLHVAAKHNKIEAIITLIKLHADPNLSNDQGETPLHIAAQMNNDEVIVTLSELGATINAQSDNGATPIFLAAQYGNIVALEQLINAGANVYASCSITIKNLRNIALQCSEKIATQTYSERIISNMERFIKKHHIPDEPTICITPYDIACIVEEEALLDVLDSNYYKRKLEQLEPMSISFFSHSKAKKSKSTPFTMKTSTLT